MDTLTPIGLLENTASFEIDRKTHKVDSRNYHPTKTKKSQILLAGSMRKNSNNLLRLKKKDFGLTKRWPMFTINREGKVFQHFDPHYYSDFMDNKEIDKKVITIVLENMGMIYFDYDRNQYINWINEVCDEEFVFEKVWKNCRYWESYTEEQFRACVNLCIHLCRTYGIKQDSLGHYVFQEDAINFKGILTRSNYNSDFSDLNPSFPWKEFIKELEDFK